MHFRPPEIPRRDSRTARDNTDEDGRECNERSLRCSRPGTRERFRPFRRRGETNPAELDTGAMREVRCRARWERWFLEFPATLLCISSQFLGVALDWIQAS